MIITAKRIIGDKPDIELSDGYFVEFGQGYSAITVAVRYGVVEVSSAAPIRLEPRAANVIWVSTKPRGAVP